MPLKVGDKAPDFEANLHTGERLMLSNLRGRVIVLYFYPRALTSGCTREAVRFNQLLDKFRELGAVVVGVSTDPPERNRRFAEKHGLRFPLASDPEGKIAELYKVLKKEARRPSARRVTYIIDGGGLIRKVIVVRPAERHADEALAAVREIVASL